MLNYLKSEHYRLLHKKSLYITSAICWLLISAAAFVLNFFPKIDSTFPYATAKFFYSNAISGGVMIIIAGYLYNFMLTGKDTALIKQSVSFGISRNVIFWSKLILTFSYFLLTCIVAFVLMIILGENFLSTNSESIKNLSIACINMVPIVISGFALTHSLKMLKMNDAYILIIVFFIYVISGRLLRTLFRPIEFLNELYKYSPNTLLNENLTQYLNDSPHLGYEYWIVGIVISVIALSIGAIRFAKKEIH